MAGTASRAILHPEPSGRYLREARGGTRTASRFCGRTLVEVTKGKHFLLPPPPASGLGRSVLSRGPLCVPHHQLKARSIFRARGGPGGGLGSSFLYRPASGSCPPPLLLGAGKASRPRLEGWVVTRVPTPAEIRLMSRLPQNSPPPPHPSLDISRFPLQPPPLPQLRNLPEGLLKMQILDPTPEKNELLFES